MRFVDFSQIVGPTYTLDDTSVEAQRCVNMYPEKVESTGEWWSKPTPGLLEFVDFGTAAPVMEGHTTSAGRAFFIAGTGFYEVFSNGTTLLHGTFTATPTSPRMADNGAVLMIVWGTTAYTFILATNTFAVLSDAGYLGGGYIQFLDQFFIVNQPNTRYFQLSPLSWDGATAWDSSDFYSAESSPDNITALTVNGSEVWVFGPDSYEVFYNTGDAIDTFQRISGAAVSIGTSAPYSVTAIQGSVFWLGGSKQGAGIVWMSSGYQPQRISNHAVEAALAAMADSTDARAWSYLDGGHYFYCMNFPSAGVTWVYDISTGMWHERDHRVEVDNSRTQHRARCQIYAFGKNLVGDFENGKVYHLTGTVWTDNGVKIDRFRRCPATDSYRETFFHKFELFGQVGAGI